MCRKALVVFSVNEMLLVLSVNLLKNKQKKILVYLKNNSWNLNVTKIISGLSKNLKCSESAAWNNLGILRKYNLVNYGSLKERGKPLTLTKTGKLISGYLRGKDD